MRSFLALRAFIKANAIYTLIRPRPPTPLCRGLRPYCGENNEPGRYRVGGLTFNPELENSQDPTRTSIAFVKCWMLRLLGHLNLDRMPQNAKVGVNDICFND